MKTWDVVYSKLFRSKYTGKALLVLHSEGENGKLLRSAFRNFVDCRDFNKFVMIPLLEMGLIEVEVDKSEYPYKTYVKLTETGIDVADKLSMFVCEIYEYLSEKDP